MAVLKYLFNLLVALDQLVTTLLGGWPDETLSSYAYRLDQKGKPGGRIFRPLIDFLFSWYRTKHCMYAYIAERKRYQFPPELR